MSAPGRRRPIVAPGPRKPVNDLDGILPVDKPAGPTSHDVVAMARRALGIRRIGHTGTLDPFASGLLLLCIGPSTRLAEYLNDLPKSYSATMRLGVTTTTDDPEGEVIRVTEGWHELDQEQVEAALAAQQGERLQVPPRYSAKKVAGERAYAIARGGGKVQPEPVRVVIHQIAMTRFDPPEVDFEVECSTGTYVRAIARDVGEDLGVGAHLTALRRTRIGPFTVDDALTPDEFPDVARVKASLVAPAQALAHLPRHVLTPAEVRAVSHGRSLERTEDPVDGPIALVDQAGDLVAVGRCEGDRLRPSKVFR